ncbi:hypothetical protein CUMW_202590, partial [Citrus unshiu]
ILNLSGCEILKSLPAEIFLLELPKKLNFSGCSKLKRLPESRVLIRWLKSLPSSICQLKPLLVLNLHGCSNLHRLPDEHSIPNRTLNYSERLQSRPKLPSNLEWLLAHRCTALESGLIFSISYESPLRHFDLSGDFKLDRNEVRGVVEDALQDMQLLAAARWKQGYFLEKCGYFVLPENEIPNCLRFQSVGCSSSITWEHFGDHHEFFCEFEVKCKDCQPHHVLERCDVARTEYVESDHLVLRYYLFGDENLNGFREHNCDIETVAVQFYFQDFATSERLECCGV